MVRCWSLDQSGGPTLLCCKNKIVLESTYKFKKLSQLRHLCCSLQKRCNNEIKNAELGANRCIKFNFRALIIFLSSSVLHPADAAWINLLIFSFFFFLQLCFILFKHAEWAPGGVSRSHETHSKPTVLFRRCRALEKNKFVFLNSACVSCLNGHLCVYVWCFMIQK